MNKATKVPLANIAGTEKKLSILREENPVIPCPEVHPPAILDPKIIIKLKIK